MTDPLVGQVINGKYRVLAPIGKGGMGKVYRAEQIPLGRAVALKVLHHRQAHNEVDPKFQQRFFLEASLCAKLSHPNIVTVHDYGRIDGTEEETYFMAMELLEGETLHERLRKRGCLSPAETISIALEIARGLREAHRHGIVHRDLKPANVMLVPDSETGERVKILDFGLVKQVEAQDRQDLTREGSFLGSPRYMSPEQIEGNAIDHRTDLYSLGVIMYQCLTGRVPFDAPSSMHILMAHLRDPVPPMRERNPACEVPAPLEALVYRLLQKKPADRVSSADELVRELRALQDFLGCSRVGSGHDASHPVPVESTVSAVEPSNSFTGAAVVGSRTRNTAVPPSPVGRGKRLLLLASVAVLSFVGVGTVMALRRQRAAVAPSRVASTVFNLHLDSMPSGAVVTEEGRLLGHTPLQVPLEAEQTRPRQFVLSYPGYRTYVHTQGPVRADTHVIAALVPEASGTSPSSTVPSGSAASGVHPSAGSSSPVVHASGASLAREVARRPVVRARTVTQRSSERSSGATAPSSSRDLDIRLQR